MQKYKHLLIVTPLIFLATAVTYPLISGDFLGWGLIKPPLAASTEAAVVDSMFRGHFFIQAFLFAIIMVPMLYAVIVFRRRDGDESDGAHIHGHTGLEVAWTFTPIVLVLVFAIWGWSAYYALIEARPNEITVQVQAQKWSWAFYYDLDGDGKADAFDTDLYVPINRTIKLEMQSTDVIHAFWVPEFRVKQDVMPFDRANPTIDFSKMSEYTGSDTYLPDILRFTPTLTGEYLVRCAEICGTNHWSMYATVHVLSQQDYDNWVSERLAALDRQTELVLADN